MNKEQLINKIVDETGISKARVKQCLELFLNTIIKALKKGKKVSLVGFGSFQVTKRKGRKGVNPRTGKEMKIPDTKVAKFKAGKRLKEQVK